MTRLALFMIGLAIVAVALPTALDHHARAEFLQSAWCLSGGREAPPVALFSWHCPACPALLAGFTLMIVSPLLNLWPAGATKRRFAATKP
ncbi:MAG: hypothetical protein RLN72_09895 [Henriciella sp.]